MKCNVFVAMEKYDYDMEDLAEKFWRPPTYYLNCHERTKRPYELTQFEKDRNLGTKNISNLKEVDLRAIIYVNQEELDQFTDFLSQCHQVHWIWMSTCNYTRAGKLPNFPSSMHKQIKNVGLFRCAGMDMVDLSSLSQLTNLHWLDLANNRLTEVPSVILSLSKLKYLNLSRNMIQVWPSDLVQFLMDAEHVLLEENTLRIPPWEVWENGPYAVASYFGSLTLDNECTLRLSLATLGNVCAGKTSLTRALVGKYMLLQISFVVWGSGFRVQGNIEKGDRSHTIPSYQPTTHLK